jgi:hypothetical protein
MIMKKRQRVQLMGVVGALCLMGLTGCTSDTNRDQGASAPDNAQNNAQRPGEIDKSSVFSNEKQQPGVAATPTSNPGNNPANPPIVD